MPPKRRKKNPPAAAVPAQPKTDRDTDDDSGNSLENVMLDFWSGILPWANNMTPQTEKDSIAFNEDRLAGVTALLDGKAAVLALDGSMGSSSTAPRTIASVLLGELIEHEVYDDEVEFPAVMRDNSESETAESTAASRNTRSFSSSSPPDLATADKKKRLSPIISGEQPAARSELYGYWMALGAHLLSRLLTEQSPEFLAASTSDDVALAYRRVLCYVCYALSVALFDDGTKWDKAGTGLARHWLARLVTTIAACITGHVLAPAQPAKAAAGRGAKAFTTPLLSRSTLAAATLCLEHAYLASTGGLPAATSSTTTSASSSTLSYMGTPEQVSRHWSSAIRPLLQQWVSENIHSEFAPSAHLAFSDREGDWTRERACLTALRANQVSLSSLQSVFQDLRLQYPALRVEGRLSYKRWTAVVLDWYAQAPLFMLQQATLLVQSPESVDAVGSVPTLALVGQWLHWMVDWSSKCGTRPPSGNLDVYLKQISFGRKKKKSPDLREVALTLSFHCIELHAACMGGQDESYQMLNDTDWNPEEGQGATSTSEDSKQPVKVSVVCPSDAPLTNFFPFMAQLLSNIALVVGVAGSTQGNLDQMENAFAALVLQQQVFRDARLIHWALQQIRALIGQPESSGGSCDNLLADPLVSTAAAKIRFHILVPSSTGSRKRKVGNEANPSPSPNQRLTVYERLALFLRAMHGTKSSPTPHSKKASTAAMAKDVGSAFVKFILSVIDSCLDTRVGPSLAGADPESSAAWATPAGAPRGKKRKPPSALSSARRSKRSKKEERAAELPDPDTGEVPSPGEAAGADQYRPISPGRALLASTALDILQTIVDGNHVQRFPCLSNGAVGMPELCHIVQTGQLVDTVLLRTRDLNKRSGEAGQTTAPYTLNPSEKKLWSSQMNVSLTVGKSFLGVKTTAQERLDVFIEVARSSKAVSMDKKNALAWPLWLPSAHWLLVSSNIANEKDRSDSPVFRFIVNGVLASIKYVLSDVRLLLSLVPSSTTAVVAEPEIPLSLQDVQLYLGALVRLKEEDRSGVIIAFATTVCDCVSKINGDLQILEVVKNNRFVSSFLARVVTTCTYAAIVSTGACDMKQQVLQTLASNNTVGTPSFWLAGDGYHLQNFMGAIGDRESTLLPPMAILPPAVDPKAAGPLRVLLETTFEMGLLAAPEDSGFLMFSAWNSLGKAPVWAPDVHSAIIDPEGDSLGSALLTVRENVCLIHSQLQHVDGITPATTITRAFHAKLNSSPDSHTVIANIKVFIDKISQMVRSLIEKDGDQHEQLGAEEFALLECSCFALSFAISALTRSKVNYVEDLVSKLEAKTRPRSYSTESEGGGSDGESGASADARVEALERIEQLVARVGGAPAYPDWLDSSCSLRYGVSLDEARSLALDTLSTIASILKRAHIEKSRSYVSALKEGGSPNSLPVLSDLALKLLVGVGCGDAIGDGENEPSSEIAKICNANEYVVKKLMDNTAAHPSFSALATWCANAAQRVHGHFHQLFRNQMIEVSELGLDEMRIGGEWEVGLAFALTSACTGFPVAGRNQSLSAAAYGALIASSRWERLSSAALTCLVPCSALVRFTSYGKGRKTHPFSKLDVCVDDYQLRRTYLPERPPDPTSEDDRVNKVVRDVVLLLSSSPIHRESQSEFIVANLFIDASEFIDLQTTTNVGSSLDTLSGIMAVNRSVREENAESFSNIVNNIVNMITHEDNTSTEMTGSIVWFFRQQQRNKRGCAILLGGKGSPSRGSFSPGAFGSEPGAEVLGNHGKSLLQLLFSDSGLLLEPDCRDYLMAELGNFAVSEIRDPSKNAIASTIFCYLTQELVKDCEAKSLIEAEIRGASGQIATASVCAMLASSFLYGGGNKAVKGFERILFDSLMRFASGSEETGEPLSAEALNLFFLYGTLFNELGSVAGWLISDTTRNAAAIEAFFLYLQELDRCLNSSSVDKVLKEDAKVPEDIQTTCSFALKEGFYEQHWFNCKTCGLVGEKGCCTLCALVCHSGHDVSYARFSSFFCDCGAQTNAPSRSETEDLPCAICKCLTPLSEEAAVHARRKGHLPGGCPPTQPEFFVKALDFASVAVRGFKKVTLESLENLFKVTAKVCWNAELEKLIRSELPSWRAEGPPFPPSEVVTYADIRKDVFLRRAGDTNPSAVSVLPLEKPFLILAGRSAPTTLNLGASVDPVAESSLRRLLKAGATRTAIGADSRGLLLVAENEQPGCQITIVNGAALPGDEVLDGCTLQRRLLPIIGTQSSGLKSVIGVSVNRANERYVLVWGADEACVFMIQGNTTLVAGHAEVSYSVDGPECYAKGQWFPSSENVFAISRGSVIQIYSLASYTQPGKLLPDASIALESSSEVKDFVVTRAAASSSGKIWHLFCVLNDGFLHRVQLTEANSGKIILSSETIGSSGSLVYKLPRGATPAHANTLRLDFLHQSRVLVYQCFLGTATGLVLDDIGNIDNEFELVPQVLKLGENEEIQGPFTHWTDLGVTRNDGAAFFRVVFVARYKANDGCVVLSAEFNQKLVRVGIVSNLGESSVDGVAAWSTPYIGKEDDDGDFLPSKDQLELCVVQADGVLTLLREKTPKVSQSQLSSFGSPGLDTTYPLLAFEKLKNIGNADLSVQVGGCSFSDIGSKLQRDSDSFFLSPKRDGFTITISPKAGATGTPAIAAVRFLVGRTSTSCIPRQVFIGGRPLDLLTGVKRWYSVILTPEEIAVTLRNGGFVTLTFTQCAEATNNPVLDALDVYGIDRDRIDSWLPQKLRNIYRLETARVIDPPKRTKHNMLSAVKSLTCLRRLKGQSSSLAKDKELLSALVSQTCLGSPEASAAAEFLSAFSIEPKSSHHTFLDRARLLSCLEFLSNCPKVDNSAISCLDRPLMAFWHANSSVLLECLKCASGIARQRPTNYIPSLEGSTVASMAEAAFPSVTQCLCLTLDYDTLVGTFVEVCLLEMAVAGSSIENTTGSMRNFAPLRALLTQQRDGIVKPACEAIARFCKKYSAPTNLGSDFDLFVTRDITYGCDSCQVMPIQGDRYTLDDDERPFDLCRECHNLAMTYAAANDFSGGKEVLIRGRPVGDDPCLTCAEVSQMQSVLMQEDAGTGRQQNFDVFLDCLFNDLVALIAGSEGADQPTPLHLIELVVDLVHLADRKRRVERKKRIIKELCHGLSLVLAQAEKSGRISASVFDQNLECFVRSLCTIIVSDPEVHDYLTGKKPASLASDGEHPTSITCGLHDSHDKAICKATENGRKFYVCGKEKCNFFVWAENSRKSKTDFHHRESEFDTEAAHHVWRMLTIKSAEYSSLHSKICSYLEHSCGRLETGSNIPTLFQPRTFEEAKRDKRDGVLCSRERLLDETADDYVRQSRTLPLTGLQHRDASASLVESCLELLCLSVGPETDKGVGPWFSVLCKILVEDKPALRALAKTAVFRLCGRDSELYFALRDHHTYGIQMKKVLALSWPALEEASLIKERARQCSVHWKDGHIFSFEKGGGFELADLQLLMAEDTLMRSSHESIRKLLGELLSSAKKRPANWRRFCRHKFVPLSVGGPGDSSCAQLLLSLPPIKSLFYLVNILPLDCQSKVAKLLDIGVTPLSGEEHSNRIPTENAGAAVLEFVEPKGMLGKATDALRLTESGLYSFAVQLVLRGGNSELRRAAGSVASKVYKLAEPQITQNAVRRFVYGPLTEVGEMGRAGGDFVSLISGLAHYVDSKNMKDLAEFVESMWSEQLLSLRHDRGNRETLMYELKTGQTSQRKRYDLAPCLFCHAVVQPGLTNGKRSGSNAEAFAGASSRPSFSPEPASSSALTSKKVWLENQVSPFARVRLENIREAHTSSEFASYMSLKHRLAVSDVFVEAHDPRTRSVKTIKVYASARLEDNIANLKSPRYKWQLIASLTLPQGGTRANTSLAKPVLAANIKIEYIDFYDRLSGSRTSDGAFIIHCPRCARVVNNAAGVCNHCGEVAFQCRKCRHINYDRLDAFLCVECGYCASGTFIFEVNAGIVSNATAITNEQEYKRAQHQLEIATRLYDDLLQCLKDQFSLLPSKIGSKKNAEAARCFSSDLMRSAYDSHNEHPAAMEMSPECVGRQGAVVRTLARPSAASSLLSASDGDHYCSVLALGRSSSGSSSASRRRNRDIIIRHVGRDLADDEESDLINLLESTDSLARAGLDPSDPLSRLIATVQSRREQRNNEENNRSSSSQSHRKEQDGTAGGGADPSGSPEAKTTKSAVEILDICDRLYSLLREAERESCLLVRRIAAWRSLFSGELYRTSHTMKETSHAAIAGEAIRTPVLSPGIFVPCHCSSCSGSLSGHLLLLWIRLFQADPSQVSVTKTTVKLLLQEDSTASSMSSSCSKSLTEYKRWAVREIALKSPSLSSSSSSSEECVGPRLILDILRLRLQASQDVGAAEILGQIVASAATTTTATDSSTAADGSVSPSRKNHANNNTNNNLKQQFIDLAKEQIKAYYG